MLANEFKYEITEDGVIESWIHPTGWIISNCDKDPEQWQCELGDDIQEIPASTFEEALEWVNKNS